MTHPSQNTPTVLVILGATGDLAAKKIFPSLYKLFIGGYLPNNFHIVNFSRRELDDVGMRSLVRETLESKIKDYDDEKGSKFLANMSYQKGDFSVSEGYQKLAVSLGRVDSEWKACSNKLFYLAVPPKYYDSIFENLSASGLTDPCSDETGWTRVMVEKPFGDNLATARSLDKKLGNLFKEEQIYRIDHYLGKEMLQNILAFRFSNNIFESSWSNKYIEKIEIKL